MGSPPLRRRVRAVVSYRTVMAPFDRDAIVRIVAAVVALAFVKTLTTTVCVAASTSQAVPGNRADFSSEARALAACAAVWTRGAGAAWAGAAARVPAAAAPRRRTRRRRTSGGTAMDAPGEWR